MKTIINTPFIPTYQVNRKLVDKSDSLRTEEEKRNFKTKNVIVMSLDDSKFFYVHNCKTTKEMWDNIEMINEVSPSVEQEEMNTRGEKDEYTTFKCFSKFRNIRNYIGKFVSTNV